METFAENAIQDAKIKAETIPRPPADYLDRDPRLEEIRNELISKWEEKNGEGILSFQGQNYLMGDVRSSNPVNIEQRAVKKFQETFPEEAKIYAEREKTRVYEKPTDDPAYKEAEKEITRRANTDSQLIGGSKLPAAEYRDLSDRIRNRETRRGWSSFAFQYPEKAAVYAAQNEFLARDLALREEQKEKKKQETERQTEKPEQRLDEETAGQNPGIRQKSDEERLREVRNHLALHSEGEPKKQESANDTVDWKSFGGRQIVMFNNESIHRYPERDKDVTSVREAVTEETLRRVAEDKTPGRDLADKFRDTYRAVNAEKWQAFVDKYPQKAKEYQGYYKEIRDILNPSQERETEQQTVPEQSETVATPEEIKPEIEDELLSKEDVISEYLAYQDAPESDEMTADEKKTMLGWSMKNESAGRYAESLQEVFEEYPRKSVEGLAYRMVSEAKDILKRLGVSQSKYIDSTTWAMWDIGKQFYYVGHPKESNEKYDIADPFQSPEKITEMINRQVGWEVYRAKETGFAEKFKKHPLYKKLEEYLNMAAKNKGTLSSKDLTDLGGLTREILKE